MWIPFKNIKMTFSFFVVCMTFLCTSSGNVGVLLSERMWHSLRSFVSWFCATFFSFFFPKTICQIFGKEKPTRLIVVAVSRHIFIWQFFRNMNDAFPRGILLGNNKIFYLWFFFYGSWKRDGFTKVQATHTNYRKALGKKSNHEIKYDKHIFLVKLFLIPL